MKGLIMSLTDTFCKNAKPLDKPKKHYDEKGLYLEVMPNGSKYWRFKYRYANKEKRLALGVYPEISLKAAREGREEARKLLVSNIDPVQKKKSDKVQTTLNANNCFQVIAKEWHELNKSKWMPSHAVITWNRLENHVLPLLGNRPIAEIKPLELLDTLRKIEKKGATETSHRMLQICNGIFRYAVIIGHIEYNPAIDLAGALISHKSSHYPTLAAKDLPSFFQKLENAVTSQQNKLAIKILMLTFLRQGELRHSKWQFVDLEAPEWRLPAHITKMGDNHIVPLCKQSITLFEQLNKFTGYSEYLFPSQQRRKHAVMSENTINKVLHNMGYKGKFVGHGVRALASTILNEHGFRMDVIERQLAHMERNKVRAAYNRAEYLAERREMMQWWGNYLEKAGMVI
jgi:integrase